MNKRALEILNRELKDKFPFIIRISFERWNNSFEQSRIFAHVDIDLPTLAQSFPNAIVDDDYIEGVGYQVHNPFHVFVDFREDDLSINDLVKILSRSVGVDVYDLLYHIDPNYSLHM